MDSAHTGQQTLGVLLRAAKHPQPQGNAWGASHLTGSSMVPCPTKDAGGYETHLHHLLGQDGVAGQVLAQERGGNLLAVLQGLGWEPTVGQARGIEELVHLGR